MASNAVRAAAGGGTVCATRRRVVMLPRLRVDPGVWNRASGADFSARILLGEQSILLEAHAADGVRPDCTVQEAEIDGRAYLVAAYEV